MLVYRTMRYNAFWEFDSIIMQNLRGHFLLFCTPTWPYHHVDENQGLYNTKQILYTPPGIFFDFNHPKFPFSCLWPISVKRWKPVWIRPVFLLMLSSSVIVCHWYFACFLRLVTVPIPYAWRYLSKVRENAVWLEANSRLYFLTLTDGLSNRLMFSLSWERSTSGNLDERRP